MNGTSTTSPATWGQQAALWPPDAAVDPAVSGNTYPAGSLDAALGIASLTFAQLQTQFGACRKSTDAGSGTLPGDCTVTSGSPPRQEQIARKEAREMILAFTAGADVVRGSDTLPMRDAAGNIRHKARTWIMAESSGLFELSCSNLPRSQSKSRTCRTPAPALLHHPGVR